MSVEELIDEVVTACCGTGSTRQKEIFASLIKHLHGFVADIKPTDEEWMSAIQFLTSVGHTCDDKRQEFILLSDVLGVTALKDNLNNLKPDEATEASVLGPFYREGVKEFALGSSISSGKNDGERCLVKGRVTDINGSPIKHALVDVWQAAANGLYEQQDDNQTDMNLRGCFKTDENGYYWLETVKPKYYPIPTDGPVGKLLKQLGRHEYRPGHIHFIASAKGFEPVITQYFDRESKYIESDTVFGVKQSLLIDFERAIEGFEYKSTVLSAGDWIATCDFVLVTENR
jgi:protocatechuate 3,4-dioxygenase beta subunit